MRNQDTLSIRRSINPLTIGQSATLQIADTPPADVIAYAKKFAKQRGMFISISETPEGVVVTRTETATRHPAYPEMATLGVGKSHLFQVPRAFHHRIRQAASFRSKTTGMRLACTVEGDGMRVTRLPVTPEEIAACGSMQPVARVTKYDLDRLSTTRELRFTIERSDHHKLRLACTNKAKTTGWTIRCRLQDDGTMLVYRTDAGAPARTPEAATTGA